MRRPPVPVLALVLAAALAGCGGATRVSGTDKNAPSKPAPPGPDAPSLHLALEARTGSAGIWSRQVRASPGEAIDIRLRIRNGGRRQTGDVLATLRLPRGVQMDPGSVHTQDVSAPALGDPVADPQDLTGGRGILLDPFGPYAASEVRLVARVPRARGTLRASARVRAAGTSATSALTIRPAGAS